LEHSLYFKRNAVFKIEGETRSLVDVQNNNVLTPLDPWMAIVVSLADGQHTIEQFVQHLAGQYPNGAPENLKETVESVISRLTDDDVIQLTAQPTVLPYYLRMPIDEQDTKQATELMLQDGFISKG